MSWLAPGFDAADPLVWGVVFSATLIAALTDLRWRRIPNVLTIPLFAAGLIFSGVRGGVPGLVEAVIASVMLAFPYVILFLWWHGGAGDAKLMGALGAWLGLAHGVVVLVAVAVSGAMIAAVLLVIERRRGHVLAGATSEPSSAAAPDLAGGSSAGPTTMPYGVAVFVGVCVWTIGGLL